METQKIIDIAVELTLQATREGRTVDRVIWDKPSQEKPSGSFTVLCVDFSMLKPPSIVVTRITQTL
jgi:hypothetical protein